MLRRGAGKLRGRGEMNEAVAHIGRRSDEKSLGFGASPQSPLADFVDRRHTFALRSGSANLSARKSPVQGSQLIADVDRREQCGRSRPALPDWSSGLERSGNNSYHRSRVRRGVYGAIDAHARAGLVGHRSSGGPRRACRLPAWPSAPDSIRPPSTNRSASPRRAARAGPRPNRSPKRWPRPARRSTYSSS